MAHRFDTRINFHDATEVMEVDFSEFHFQTSKDVNDFYDRVEERIAETGEQFWYFLVNYHNTRIDPSAWFAYSQRGKTLNLAHSQGSVRFDPSEATRAEIARRSETDEFDANLFADRDSALARLVSLPSKRRAKIVHEATLSADEFARRISFDHALQVMDADFSNITFSHSLDVNNFYDFIEARMAEMGGRWYFAVNYENCRINPEAWVQYAQRGKRLNLEFGLGSVRYAPLSEAEAEIRLRAESQDFDPNICASRDEALQRIAVLKREG
jgi:hypothetical protein